jgi:hypothetical protein
VVHKNHWRAGYTATAVIISGPWRAYIRNIQNLTLINHQTAAITSPAMITSSQKLFTVHIQTAACVNLKAGMANFV